MIPDYVLQMQEIQRQFESTANVLKEDWKDDVQKRFYDDFVTPFSEDTKTYMYGGSGIYGMGLDELLKLMEKQMNAMSSLAGVNVTADVVAVSLGGHSSLRGLADNEVVAAGVYDGAVHDEYRDRDYWHQEFPYNHGPKPGELMHNEMNQVTEERENSTESSYSDFRRRMGLNV